MRPERAFHEREARGARLLRRASRHQVGRVALHQLPRELWRQHVDSRAPARAAVQQVLPLPLRALPRSVRSVAGGAVPSLPPARRGAPSPPRPRRVRHGPRALRGAEDGERPRDALALQTMLGHVVRRSRDAESRRAQPRRPGVGGGARAARVWPRPAARRARRWCAEHGQRRLHRGVDTPGTGPARAVRALHGGAALDDEAALGDGRHIRTYFLRLSCHQCHDGIL
mmetsp:Transcript_37932/g.94660  ORF Transcript_37932/g.94660 Transcript_37932/m.94660 type:complete len:227 (+) Transcript_37932:251-931(+)